MTSPRKGKKHTADKRMLSILFLFIGLNIFGQTVSISSDPTNDTATEGSILDTDAVFVVTLDAPALVPITINYNVNGSATISLDHGLVAGSVIMGVGEMNKEIVVSGIVDDTIAEGDETVLITITPSPNYTIATANAEILIFDNDLSNVTINATDASSTEELGDTGIFTIDLGRINNTGGGIVVTFQVSGTAEASDYNVITNTIVIPDGLQRGTILITPIDDDLVESTETIEIDLLSVSNGGFDVSTAVTAELDILDNDVASVIVNATDTTAQEGEFPFIDNGVFTIDIGKVNNTGLGITVNYMISGTATPTTDYLALSGTVLVAVGNRYATVIVEGIVEDVLAEGQETVIITLASTSSSSYTIGSPNTALVTISECLTDADNDCDSDGLTNAQENAIGSSPILEDTDGDGVNDNVEVGSDISNPLDSDGDGIIDVLESIVLDSDGDTIVDQEDPDNNNACVPNINAGNCVTDSDNDGLEDAVENTLGTDINLQDTDGDGISDLLEVGADFSAPIDVDGDGIIDALDSNSVDTDADGILDYLDNANTDPCLPLVSESCIVDLIIVKTVDKQEVIVEEEVEFTIAITNAATIVVSEAIIEEILSNKFKYVSHSVSSGVYDIVTGEWSLENMESESVETLVIVAKVVEAGELNNTATLKSAVPEDNTVDNNSSEVTVSAIPKPVNNKDCGFVFNQFSPNQDGINDYFSINCIERFKNNSLEIYNRYGVVVYKKSDYDNSWDGTSNVGGLVGKGNQLPNGTYFYSLDLGDDSEVRKGWIQIIR